MLTDEQRKVLVWNAAFLRTMDEYFRSLDANVCIPRHVPVWAEYFLFTKQGRLKVLLNHGWIGYSTKGRGWEQWFPETYSHEQCLELVKAEIDSFGGQQNDSVRTEARPGRGHL